MAAGDVYNQGISEVAQNEYFDIRPPSGTEVVIHNINHSTDCTLEFYDGANSISIESKTGAGAWSGCFYHCTNSKYYRVKNTNASANNISCDGIQTK